MMIQLRGLRRFACWAIGLIVLYVLSVGPMYWLGFRGYWRQGAIYWPATFYYPLWAITNPSWQGLLKWYVHLGL